MTARKEISRGEAEELARRGWREVNLTSCDRFEYAPPTGIGATGSCEHLFGYRGDHCEFYVACFNWTRPA